MDESQFSDETLERIMRVQASLMQINKELQRLQMMVDDSLVQVAALKPTGQSVKQEKIKDWGFVMDW